MNPRNLQTGPEPTPQPKVPFKPRIKPSYFPLNNGCLIGILTMVSYSPHSCVVFFYPLYIYPKGGTCFHCSYNFVWCAYVHTMRKTHKRYKVKTSNPSFTSSISVRIVSSTGGFYCFKISNQKTFDLKSCQLLHSTWDETYDLNESVDARKKRSLNPDASRMSKNIESTFCLAGNWRIWYNSL